MIQIAICDDEREVGFILERFIQEFAARKDIDITTESYDSGEALIKDMEKEKTFDLIFLDIEFPHKNGVEIGKYIRNVFHNEITQIVYISSMTSHAMELFEVRPMNFLVKPLREEKIVEVLDKAIELLQKQGRMFAYRKGWEEKKIPISEILYFESLGKVIRIVMAKESVSFYGSLQETAECLGNSRFFYPHKSYLVNYNQIIFFTYDTLTMSNGDKIMIAQPRRKEVRKLQSKYELFDGEGEIL